MKNNKLSFLKEKFQDAKCTRIKVPFLQQRRCWNIFSGELLRNSLEKNEMRRWSLVQERRFTRTLYYCSRRLYSHTSRPLPPPRGHIGQIRGFDSTRPPIERPLWPEILSKGESQSNVRHVLNWCLIVKSVLDRLYWGISCGKEEMYS